MLMTDQVLSREHAFFKTKTGFLFLDNLKRGVLYNSSFTLDLVTGQRRAFSVDEMFSELERQKVDNSSKGKVLLAFYELGEVFELDKIPEETSLLLSLEFSSWEEVDCFERDDTVITFKEKKGLSSDIYSSMFDKVMGHLYDGDCYQINLTHNFEFKIEAEIEKTYRKFLSYPSLSEYAHTIFLPSLDILILSNSPESLFSIEDNTLITRPIKGTVKEIEGEEALKCSLKDESELNIITDLLRNDLSRIGTFYSEVVSKKSFLRVPGLIHQYSKIKVKLEDKSDLLAILKALFPGGSITGAPKKRVVKLISEIEKSQRGIYTGSTILFHGNRREASINIRTATIKLSSNSLSYGAGGGVTVLSEKEKELIELRDKLKSFFDNLF